jgi:NTE family protein
MRLSDPGLALVLTGGGARAAYQVGFLRHLASRHPDLSPGIVTGISAGSIIAAWLAEREGELGAAINQLSDVWRDLRTEDVFRVDPGDLTSRVTRWGIRLVSGGAPGTPRARSLLDTAPLRELLTRNLKPNDEDGFPDVARNLEAGRLRALALTASSYTTGRSVTWVQDAGGCGVLMGDRPVREIAQRCLGIDHVMASCALPFFFPAVAIDGAWYGDGGIRLTAPLSPAIHLGARRIIAISTRYSRGDDTTPPVVNGYPPPAQVASVLLNAIFLDLLDTDALRLQQINRLLDRLPPEAHDSLRPIDLLILRPSQDLGLLANEFEADLPRTFRFLVRGLGSRETRSNDMLSLLMFQSDYIARVMELGEADARARSGEIEAFLRQELPEPQRQTARDTVARYLQAIKRRVARS